MSVNPSRRERWSIPATTRHVWVLRQHRWQVPFQGYVLAWRHHSYRWAALVVYVDTDDPEKPVVQKWVPKESLVPVRSVPDELMRNAFPEYRRRRDN